MSDQTWEQPPQPTPYPIPYLIRLNEPMSSANIERMKAEIQARLERNDVMVLPEGVEWMAPEAPPSDRDWLETEFISTRPSTWGRFKAWSRRHRHPVEPSGPFPTLPDPGRHEWR